MKKLMYLGVLCILLFGCSAKLDENYDEKQLEEKAMEVIGYLNDEDYEKVTNMGDAKMNTPELTAKLKEAWSFVKIEFGEFVAYDDFNYASQDGLGVVIAVVSYENNKVQFTISFNQELELAGIYFK